MTKLSSDRVESMAITQFRGILDEMALKSVLLRYDIKEGDRGPIWDGNVDFYEKDNRKLRYTIDFQVKGRSIGHRKFTNSFSFNGVEKWQLENYKVKNGTILIACLFRNNYSEKKLYYASLMPYEIDRILNEQYKLKKKMPSIKMRPIEDVVAFYRVCEQFNYDKKMQSGLSSNFFDNSVYQEKYGRAVEFMSYGRNAFDAMMGLMNSDSYYYTLDDLGRTVNVSRGKLASFKILGPVVVKDSSGKVVFSNEETSMVYSESGEVFRFGNSFSINLEKNEFVIKFAGSFKSRLRELVYLQDAMKTGKIYVDNFSIDFNFRTEVVDYFDRALAVYGDVVEALEKYHVDTNINIDVWSDKDLRDLGRWLDAIENGKPLNMKRNILGCVQIGAMKLSALCTQREDGLYDVRSIWGNDAPCDGEFRIDTGDDSFIGTKNIYLALPPVAFLADDLNLDVAKNNIEWERMTGDEYILANLQALNAIKAYDDGGNIDLLSYAKWLLDNLMKYNNIERDIYFINEQQIRKRFGKIEDDDFDEIVRIKGRTASPLIKLCCCLLMDSKLEAEKIFGSLTELEKNYFLSFPISKFLG